MQACPGDLRHTIGGEAEPLQQLLEGSGRPEGVHADDRATVTDVPVPAHGGRLLDGDPGRHGRREHLVAVGLVLPVEQLPTGHAHHPGGDALGSELLASGHRKLHLRTGGEQEDVRGAGGSVGKHVGAPRHARGRAERGTVEGGESLPGEDQHSGLAMQPGDGAPGLDDLVGVRRPEDEQARHRPQGSQLLDRLVRRTVLAHADRVVGEDVQNRDLHQRREPDGAAA